jgi:hypothetical protein
MRATKDTNPKDAIAGDKLPMDLVPETLIIYTTLAMLEGALKYGKYNWRAAGARSSVYIGAIKRHLAKFNDGQWADPKSGVPHIASIAASCAIILDAAHVGKLLDDRPPSVETSQLVDALSKSVVALKKTFRSLSPHQHTIQDAKRDSRRKSKSKR